VPQADRRRCGSARRPRHRLANPTANVLRRPSIRPCRPKTSRACRVPPFSGDASEQPSKMRVALTCLSSVQSTRCPIISRTLRTFLRREHELERITPTTGCTHTSTARFGPTRCRYARSRCVNDDGLDPAAEMLAPEAKTPCATSCSCTPPSGQTCAKRPDLPSDILVIEIRKMVALNLQGPRTVS
jgi:hypothetical protein